MVVESLHQMATKLGEEELELCLSLGGPFKKTEISKPIKSCTDEESNAVSGVEDIGVNLDGGTMKREINATRRKETRKKEERSGEEGGECKRIKTECNGITNGVDLVLSFGEVGNGYGSPVSNSSSEISDPTSSAQQGGCCDFEKKSNQIKPVSPPVNGEIGSDDAKVAETQERSISVLAKETRKPPKPRSNGNGNGNGVNGGLLPFAQMPCVTSTGNGPEGKTVNGFLYRYSKSEISIICVCHGTSFSPAEFIVHAGGTDVSHPLRHITVVPSTF